MSIKHGYQPMHPPVRHVTQEEMWETLAKHAKPPVSVKALPAAQSPKEKSPPLEWGEPKRTSAEGAGYVRTVCGRFSVSKDGNKTDGFSYTAWSRATTPATNLGCRLKKEEAMALCEADR